MGRRRLGLFFGVWVLLVLVAVFGVVLNVPLVWGNGGTIYIRADGSIDPPTAPIQRNGDLYTFTDFVFEGIVVQRSSITIDGNGYWLSGLGGGDGFVLSGINNVIIKNVTITDFSIGVYLSSSNYNTISGNSITFNEEGVRLVESSNYNTFSGNSFTENGYGVRLNASSNNQIYHNNFVNNNIEQVNSTVSTNVWDDGYPNGGNYWSDYNGQDLNGDGIGDSPYIIDENNQDNYPLMELWPDITPPVTIDDYDGLWHTQDFTVTLTASDKGGVKDIYYRINDGQNMTVSADGQPLITTDGANNKLEYWSVDNVGNEESHNLIVIGLDKTPPTGYIIISANWNWNATYSRSTSVTLNLNATDAASGVYQVRFSKDGVWDTETWEYPQWAGYPWMSKTWELTPGDGTKTVYAQFMDNAGWISLTYQNTIILDATKPIADAGQDRTINMGVINPFNPLPSVTFDASGSSDNFGIVSYEWNFGDGYTGEGKTIDHAYNYVGNYTVTLTVRDAAGNVATDSITVSLLSEGVISPGKVFEPFIIAAFVIIIIVIIAIVVIVVVLFKKRE